MGVAMSSQAYDGQSQFAAKLASKRKSCLIVAFMSPSCGLCASLRPALDQVACGNGGTAASSTQIAVLDAQQDQLWAPEMLTYNVEMVPCFVLLDAAGRAICKTRPPRSRQQMEAALQEMVQHAATLGT